MSNPYLAHKARQQRTRLGAELQPPPKPASFFKVLGWSFLGMGVLVGIPLFILTSGDDPWSERKPQQRG
jgi:hypothetical protein